MLTRLVRRLNDIQDASWSRRCLIFLLRYRPEGAIIGQGLTWQWLPGAFFALRLRIGLRIWKWYWMGQRMDVVSDLSLYWNRLAVILMWALIGFAIGADVFSGLVRCVFGAHEISDIYLQKMAPWGFRLVLLLMMIFQAEVMMFVYVWRNRKS